MYININLEAFRTAFATHCGGQYANNFTYKGLKCLFNYLENCEDSEHSIELDVVAFSCEYAEYTYAEVADILQVDTRTPNEDLVLMLGDHTDVCGTTPDTVVCLQF